MSHGRLTALLTLALVVAASLATEAGARPAAPTGEIAFTAKKSSSGDPYAYGIQSDGTGLRRLPLGKRDRAWWSPDGTRVVVARGKLSVMNADGTGGIALRVSCAVQCDVAWSPRGTWIAYTVVDDCSSPPCASRLAVVRSNGQDRKVLLRFVGATVEAPSWSPDGKTIAFVEEASGIQDLNTVGANGKGFTRLAPADGGIFYPRYRPVWTQDGSRILFSAKRGGKRVVLSISRTGDDLQNLAEGWWPVLSPDGTQIAFVAGDDNGYVAPKGGGQATLIARRFAGPPVWSPDGKEIAYISTDRTVRVARASGGKVKAITDVYARLDSLAWLPGG